MSQIGSHVLTLVKFTAMMVVDLVFPYLLPTLGLALFLPIALVALYQTHQQDRSISDRLRSKK